MPPFQYPDYQNRFAGSIGDLMLRRGDIEAQRATAVAAANARAMEVTGQADAGAAQGVAGAVTGAIQQATDPRRQLEAQQLDTTKKAQAFTTMVNGIVSKLTVQKADGSTTLDRGKLQQAFASANVPPALQEQTFKSLDDVDASIAKFTSAKVDHLADLAHSVLQAGATPDNLAYGIALAKANHLVTDEQLQPVIDAVAGGADVKQLLTGVRGMSEKYKDADKEMAVPAGGSVYTPSGGIVATAPDSKGAATVAVAQGRAAELARHNTAMEAIATKSEGRLESQQQELARHNKEMERLGEKRVDATANDKTDLSPEGLDAAALNYAKTGQLPPLGNGDKTTRKSIINRAAQMMPGLDVASAKADYTANTASLKTIQAQRDAVSAFENTAKKNIQIFLDTAGKVVDTGSPMANKLVREVSGSMAGSPDQAAYEAARQVAINEVAKIVSNPSMAGQLSDSARHEVEGFNPANATLKQSVAVMRVLLRDMDNRATSYDDQIAGIKARISKAGTPGAAPGAAAPTAPAAGVTVSAPSGKAYTFPTQEAADAFVAAAKAKGLWK